MGFLIEHGEPGWKSKPIQISKARLSCPNFTKNSISPWEMMNCFTKSHWNHTNAKTIKFNPQLSQPNRKPTSFKVKSYHCLFISISKTQFIVLKTFYFPPNLLLNKTESHKPTGFNVFDESSIDEMVIHEQKKRSATLSHTKNENSWLISF